MTTLLLNGCIHSPTHPDATAMAVRGDLIAWLGSDAAAGSRFPDAEVIDLRGAFVAPAFVDSHVHVTATGLARTGCDLGAATSAEHMLRLLADHAAAHPDGVLWAHGWDESDWPDPQPPGTAEIDAVLGSRPAYLARVDVHSALAGTALRDIAGVAPDARGAALTADAHHRVRAAARALLSPAQRSAARTAALDAFAAAGVVAVHECAGPDIGGEQDWQELRGTAHGVEVTGYWGQPVTSAKQARDLLAQTGARGLAGDLFVDGALGSRTAWLSAPYADAPDCRGNRYLDVDTISAHVRACTGAGVPAGFHVIGDGAVAAVVEAFGRVVEDLGVRAVARCGHRLEHLEMITAAQAVQLGQWGVIASVQPGFDALWGGGAGMYAQRLGPARAAKLNPLALLASQDVPLAFGSDSPVTGIDPWVGVRAAIRHRTPGSALSAHSAFAAATRGAWRAGGVRDGVTGTLVPGAMASYAVWDVGELEVADPRSGRPRLPCLGLDDPLPRCRATVHRGTVIFGDHRG